jgi:hypothetical protein
MKLQKNDVILKFDDSIIDNINNEKDDTEQKNIIELTNEEKRKIKQQVKELIKKEDTNKKDD